MDYILFDYIYHTHGTRSLQMKTMLSGADLVSTPKLQDQFKKCIKVFEVAEKKWKTLLQNFKEKGVSTSDKFISANVLFKI